MYVWNFGSYTLVDHELQSVKDVVVKETLRIAAEKLGAKCLAQAAGSLSAIIDAAFFQSVC